MVSPAGPAAPSMEERLKAFNSVPLFMQSLPTEETDDVALSALQALIHEGTPDEVAKSFKENGNDYFKGKRYREALGFYTQGVDAKPTDPAVLEALLCNRAACNLELKNYGSVLRDCSKALVANPQSVKAFYRSAMALVAVERFDEALDCCDRCLAFDPDNGGVKTVRERATKGKAEQEKKEAQRAQREKQEKEAKFRLAFALRERNIVTITPTSAEQPYRPHFDPEDSTGQTLILPVWFLYPEHGVSDIISQFHEHTAFGDHLDAMFPPGAPPPAFDPAGKAYAAGNLAVYATTRRKRIFKVGRNTTLHEVCAAARGKEEEGDGLEMKAGCLSFTVVPRGEVEKGWIEEFKRSRDGGKA